MENRFDNMDEEKLEKVIEGIEQLEELNKFDIEILQNKDISVDTSNLIEDLLMKYILDLTLIYEVDDIIKEIKYILIQINQTKEK